MTPDEISKTRPIRIVESHGPERVVFSSKKTGTLLESRNDRGAFEILLPPDRHDRIDLVAEDQAPVLLRGFWRRRSGFHPDGRRHFVWTLIVLDRVSRPLLEVA